MAALGAQILCPASQASASTESESSRRPNVILIVADDLGYADLGCYGATRVQTPASDRLASQGVRLTNAHAAAATSTPARYSLLTGEYAWRRPGTDVAPGNAGMIIRPEQYTMADLFRNAGYRTAAIGKWHLGLGDKTAEQDWNAPLPTSPADIGFDYHYIMAATADRVPCVFIENGAVVDYDPEAPIYVDYRKPFAGEPTGRQNPELLTNLRSSHGHDQAIVNGIGRIGYMKGGGKALWKDENIADSITEHALGFIRENADHPFFMYLCTNDVHVPRFPHERFRGKSPMGLRGDAIAQFDWTVGKVLDELDSLGLADNTIVILTSDNGPVLDDGYEDGAEELRGTHSPTGPYRGNKYSAFEGGTMVPAIVRWPGQVEAGSESDALVSHIDWLASFGQLVDARIPAGEAPDSRPMLPALLGTDSIGAPWVLGYSSDHILSVRTPQWKYIEPSDASPMITWGPKIETGASPLPQLYNMQTSDAERDNEALARPEVVYDMQNILRRVRAKRGYTGK